MKRKLFITLFLAIICTACLSLFNVKGVANANESFNITLKPNYFTQELWCFGDEYKPTVSTSDVIVTATGEYSLEQTVVSVTVKTPTANDFVAVDGAFTNFNAYGEYVFKYVAVCKGATSNVVERKITVVDGVAPNFNVYENSEIIGAVKVSNEGDVLKTFKAIKGATLKFATVYAYDSLGVESDLTSKINVNVNFNGQKLTTAEDAYNANKYNFEFVVNQVGLYSVEYSVSDGFNEVKLNYVIDVRPTWLEIDNDLVIDEVVNSGTSIVIDKVNVVDYYGNVKNCNAKATLYKGNEEVYSALENFKYDLLKSGNYKLVLTATDGLETANEKVYEFTVVDKTAPTFKVEGEIETEIVLGNEIILPTVSVSDNNDGIAIYTLEITCNGRAVNFYDNKFTPIKEGEYVVKYYATDVAGNYSEYVFKVNVVKNNVFNVVNVILIAVAILVVAGFVVVMIISKKKKDGANAVENIEN